MDHHQRRQSCIYPTQVKTHNYHNKNYYRKKIPLCLIPHDVDICIGWNEDDTSPDRMLLECVATYFKDCGYSIGINKPFSNSKTFPGASGYHSLMIEVNKRCYMNEETLEKTPNFTNLHNQLQRLYEILLGWNMGLVR